ncbi:MAG: hypothetical protein ACREO8_13910 [Luteimonas sp.]
MSLQSIQASPSQRTEAYDAAVLAWQSKHHADAGRAIPTPPPARYVAEPSYNPSALAFQPQSGNGSSTAAANGPSFDAQVRGQDPQAIDLELMQISNAAYSPGVTQVGNWTRMNDTDLAAAGIDPATLENPDTGLRAGIYQNAEGQTVLAFSGSNELQDWTGANFEQGVGWQNEQYDQAVQLAQQADAAFGDNLVITGHSLGGGLAAAASLATGNAAVTFNASGVHDNSIERLGLDPATAKADAEAGQIRRYNIGGEVLTAAQEDVIGLRNLMPDAPGHEINLADPAPPQLDTSGPFWEQPGHLAQYLIDKVARPAQLHQQQPVIDALTQQRPWQ